MVADQVIKIVENVAEKLGVAVDKVYPMLLNQAKVFCSTFHVSVGVMVVSFVLLIIGAIGFIIADDNYSSIGMAASIVCIVVSGIAFMVSTITVLVDLTNYFTALYNPEWWAIEYVTKLLT